MKTNMKRLRKGLYEINGLIVERLDETSEVYPGDLDYRRWTVTQDDDRWLMTFRTLDEASNAITESEVRA